VSDAAQDLEEALAATSAALEAGDAAQAAEASGRAARACQDLAAEGRPLPAEQLDRLAALQASCLAGAGRTMGKLGAELSVAARSTRATTAYRR
jgi:hypothetical protein